MNNSEEIQRFETHQERLYSASDVREVCENIVSETKGLTVPDGTFGGFGSRLPNRLHEQEIIIMETAFRKLFQLLMGVD